MRTVIALSAVLIVMAVVEIGGKPPSERLAVAVGILVGLALSLDVIFFVLGREKKP